ncbi:MAG: type II secretion system protein N [Reinekea sp.]|nr:type II secretion system protein N [Reinekea sp.]
MDYRSQLLKVWLPAQSVLVILVTIVCGIWMAQITWFFLSPSVPVSVPSIKPAISSQGQSGPNWLQISREVAGREFFGDVVIQESAPVEQVEAPETKLNFTLQAVIAQGEGTGFAVIGQRGAAGKVFGVGEDLFGQATLSAVYGDRVIIDRNGQLETLRYEKLQSSILQSVVDDPVEDDSSETFQEALAQANAEVASGGDLQTQVQGMVDYVTRRANEDPEGFVQEMGLEPTDGGYQVTRRARQLQMVGLRPGDVITSVNDMQVGNIQSDQMLLNQVLQTGGELKIQIRRGSRSFTIYQSIPSY